MRTIKKWNPRVIAALIAFVSPLVLFGLKYYTDHLDKNEHSLSVAEGKIITPLPSTIVDSHFVVDGEIKNIPVGYVMWLANVGGDVLYPHLPKIDKRSGKWQIEFYEDGNAAGEKFKILLIIVDEANDNIIEKYISTGDASGVWRGIKKSDLDYLVLDYVDLIMK